jgi:anaerobic magnesium-protoporphyrin IX monomethyl ester cyclase
VSDVVLFFPRTDYMEKGGLSVHPPLSVLYPGATLRRCRYSVRIIDQRVEPAWRRELTTELRSRPLCLGISAMTGRQIHWGMAAARLAREARSDVPIVWGGVHASLLPAQTVASDAVDYVVAGEAEGILPAFVRHIEARGDARAPAGVVSNPQQTPAPSTPPDLDALPFPAYDLIDVSKYRQRRVRGRSSFPLLTSRGCPESCAFCYNGIYHHRRWRCESPEKTLEHIALIHTNFGRSTVDVQDDNFFVSTSRVERLCTLVLQRGLRTTFKATCRVDHVLGWDQTFVELLRKAGVTTLFIGAESGSDRMLELLNKGHTVADVVRCNRKLSRAGIAPRYSFMAGFPGESTEETDQTVELMLRLLADNPEASCTFLQRYVPYPGTPLASACESVGWSPPESLAGWSSHSWYGFSAPWLTAEAARRLDLLSITTMLLGSRSGRDVGLSGFRARAAVACGRRAHRRLAAGRTVGTAEAFVLRRALGL